MATKLQVEQVTKTFTPSASSRRRWWRGQFREAQSPTTPVVALRDIDLTVDKGEFLSLVGPSGCGKSTLLDLLAGLTPPTAGRISQDGNTVTGPGLDRGVVFQNYAILPWRSAQGNVEFALEATGLPRSERAQRAAQYLEMVGLHGFESRYPHELSGGMKQRVAIARSLAYDPDVLLMDEPFAALDAQSRESLQDELLRIWARTNKTIVFITHAIDEAVYLGQRVAVMTARPGTIKEVVEVPATFDAGDGDVRSSADFAHYRHQVWTLLHQEVARSEQPLSPDPRPESPDDKELASVG